MMDEEQAISTVAADIAQVVEETAKQQKAVQTARIVPVQRLQEKEYKDPTSEQYTLERDNLISTPIVRETEEGIALMHKTIHSTGEEPLW